MMNRIGKALVLVNTAISLVGLSWALGLYMQYMDWGWKEPRAQMGLRVPSEYDKRAASFREAVKARDLALTGFRAVQSSLREAEQRFPLNHLFYNQEIARLQKSNDPIEVKAIARDGKITLDTPGKAIGHPVLKEKVEGITKSYDSYVGDLKKINEDIDVQVKEIRAWTEKAKEITILLNGIDESGKRVPNTVGIYGLLGNEKKAQDEAKLEKDYLEPIWARTLREAESFRERREQLEGTLERLRHASKR